MFRIGEYRKEPRTLADLLLWAGLVAPGVVLNKDGSLQRSYAFRGPDLESSTEAELLITAEHVNNALRRLTAGWSVFVEARRDTSVGYPLSTWPNRVGALVDEERRAAFEDRTTHFETHYYLTLSWMTPTQRVRWVEHLLFEHVPGRTEVTYREAIDDFVEACTRIENLFADVLPYLHPLDDGETLTYLHSTISSKRHRVAVPEVPFYLDTLLADAPLTGGTKPMLGEVHLRVVTVKAFPSATFPGIVDRLNHLDIPYRYVVRYLPLDKPSATRLITAYQRKWFAKRKSLLTLVWEAITQTESPMENHDAVRTGGELDHALTTLSSDAVSFGYFTASVCVWDTDPDVAEDKRGLIERVINGQGFVTHAEDLNAVEAWLGSLPANGYANVRRPLLSSKNVAHMMPVSAVWAGPEEDPYWHAPPLITADTYGHTPFRYALHHEDVGHTLIIGPTGSGKTVLLGLMALQFLRYEGAQVYLFDKKQGLRAVTECVGGHHYIVGDSDAPIAFQPLRSIDTGERERSWAADWIEGLLVQQHMTLTPADRAEIWRALVALSASLVAQRTMTGFQHMIQYDHLRQGVEPYTLQGAHGQLLDADHDAMRIGSWLCFEMEPLFTTPRMVAPTLSYQFHRLESRFRGAPTLLMLDEAWLYLDHPLFAEKLAEWLKTLRKANVSVVFATQSLSDTAESRIAPVIQESCFTRIFLPNKRAIDEQIAPYYRAYGLNDRQIATIAGAVPKREYYYDSPRGRRLFSLELGEIALAILEYTPSGELSRLKEEARTEQGSFVSTLLRAKALSWAAALVGGDEPLAVSHKETSDATHT